jgi:Fic family protein
LKIPIRPPSHSETLSRLIARSDGDERLNKLFGSASLGPAPGGKYRHWDTFRQLPTPQGVTSEEEWFRVKLARRALYQKIALRDIRGQSFQYALVNPVLELLHTIDRDASGTVQIAEQVANPASRDRYLVSSLVEEAITSSQLEGAGTTRQVAKAMLREGRPPRDRGERMIANNFAAMQWLLDAKPAPLTPETVFAVQRTLTEGTLEDPSAAGRFRRDDEEIVIGDDTGQVLYRPPPAGELTARLEAMCAFANGASASGEFVHPVVRSILLHFWLAYDHPFVDGNGRTARALFYWSMARNGYWLCEYVSISRILRHARAQYLRSYLYTETDENDTTYFLLDQLRVLRRGIDELHGWLGRKAQEQRRAESLARNVAAFRGTLNERQLALLGHALRHPEASYTLESHRRSHAVSYQTARTDLLTLAEVRLLEQHKRGKAFVFTVPVDFEARLSGAGSRT